MSRAPKRLNPHASWSSLFGATVRRLRLGMRSGRPLTQEELGRQIGYSDAAVGAVERAALRPDSAFMEGCERVLPADGMLRAMFPFVLDEWATWERTGQRPLVDPAPRRSCSLTPFTSRVRRTSSSCRRRTRSTCSSSRGRRRPPTLAPGCSR
jgi:hypothetical protein